MAALTDKARALARVQVRARHRAEADRALWGAVKAAHGAGCSYRQLAAASGYSTSQLQRRLNEEAS